MTSLELELFLAVPSSEFNTYWIPCTWFINLLKDARQNQRTPDPQGLKLIMEVRKKSVYNCLIRTGNKLKLFIIIIIINNTYRNLVSFVLNAACYGATIGYQSL